jgi:hypothetical protein
MMTTTPDGRTSTRKGKPESAAEQGLAEEMVARAREQGMSLTGPDELLSAATRRCSAVAAGGQARRTSTSQGACPITNPALANPEHAGHSASSSPEPLW